MHGQVLSPVPLSRAIEYIFEDTGKIPVIYMTPSGQTLEQKLVEQLSSSVEECIIICGHYEWIDQRVIDIYVDYEISLGEYILTGWEFPAQILMDSLIRLIPEALGSSISHEEESFSKKLDRQKEYPIYTRPQIFQGKEVPGVLLSGNHKEIDTWKRNNLR